MSSGVRFDWSDAAFHQLLNSPEVMGLLEETASSHAPNDGYAYEVETSHGSVRGQARIVCADVESVMHNRATNSLVKAIGGG